MSKYYKEEDLERALIGFVCETGIDEDPYDYAVNVLDNLPTIEGDEDAVSRATVLEIYSDLYWIDERLLNFKDELDKVYEKLRTAPSVLPTAEQSSEVGEWKWEANDICHNCGYKIPHLERIVGETVLMDSKDWQYCPNCGAKKRGKDNDS